jgi:phage-related baseplate assembly protein
MYEELNKKILSLAEPKAFEGKEFDEILAENISLAKEVLGDSWIPSEADPYLQKLRVMSLRGLMNDTDKSLVVKSLLKTTATGADLDHLFASDNIFRKGGEYPYAEFEVSLLQKHDKDQIIPKGLVLNSDDDSKRAFVSDDYIIKAGELSVVIKAELNEYIESSDIKTENLATHLTFPIKIKQLSNFQNGAVVESDERFRLRGIASHDRYNTAGSKEAYIYHTFSADNRISDVSIPDDNEPLEVNIYITSNDYSVDEQMITRVQNACNSRYIRPLGDKVSVKQAEIKEVVIKATISLFDILNQSNIHNQIKTNFETSFLIGEDFVKSDFIRRCHIDGVYSVDTDFETIETKGKEVIKIVDIDLTYTQAEL